MECPVCHKEVTHPGSLSLTWSPSVVWMVEHHLSDASDDLSWCYERLDQVLRDRPEQLLPLLSDLIKTIPKGVFTEVTK